MAQPSSVRQQYESYPYPERDPKDEDKRLILGSPSHWMEIDHYVFAGRRDWSQPFRALVAGGGTGDGAIMLAQQMADLGCPAHIQYIDLSESAMAIARARAERRGLTNIAFQGQSLLEHEKAVGARVYDYIDCCGVLHHLPDPGEGLAALARLLAPDGGMGVMLYGTYGRTGVYEMQDLLRLMNDAAKPPDQPAQRLEVARRLIRQLPPGNWLRRNPVVGDHLNAGDAGVYDLLLHSVDRAFTIGEVFDLVDAADLAVTGLIEPVRYDPSAYISDPVLSRRLVDLDWRQRCGFAEKLSGTLKRHVFYAVPAARARQAATRVEGRGSIPVCLRAGGGAGLAEGIDKQRNLVANLDGFRHQVALSRLGFRLLQQIDNQRSLGTLFDSFAAQDSSLTWAHFFREAERLLEALIALNLVLIRNE